LFEIVTTVLTYDTHPKKDGGSHHRGQRERQDVVDKVELVRGDRHFSACFTLLYR
jgi:hypothetical protein